MYSKITADFKNEKIAIHRFCKNADATPILLIHGSIENSKLFYTKSGKGLAPYLAKNGFDVFAPDLRGKGESIPKVSKHSIASQTDTIAEEIPFYIDFVQKHSNKKQIHIGAHSWGGVLLLSYLALNSGNPNMISGVFFGSKRRIGIQNFQKFKMVDLGWNLAGRLFTNIYGFLPAKKLQFGSDNEPAGFFRQTNHWVYSQNWVDPENGFDYGNTIKCTKLPPILYLTGKNDLILGNPKDVERLMIETGAKNAEFKILSKANGNKQDYGHIDILTHHDCSTDHFPMILDWMKLKEREHVAES